MILPLSEYKSIIFDCDGVLLDSNKIKQDAFHLSAMPWGLKPAEDLLKYHITNGGISRHKKFHFFIESILPSYSINIHPADYKETYEQ